MEKSDVSRMWYLIGLWDHTIQGKLKGKKTRFGLQKQIELISLMKTYRLWLSK